MNWRMLLIASLGLNTLLGAFALKRLTAGATPSPELAEGADRVADLAVPEVRTITREVMMTNTLPASELEWPRWSDWVSEDWGELRTNLLAVGCPEVTVREILHASLQRAQFTDQQAILASVRGIVFWDELARHGIDGETGPLKQAVEELDVIDRRYDELGQQVLAGLPKRGDLDEERWVQRNREQQFDHLEPGLQQRAAGLVKDHERRRGELMAAHRDERGQLTPEGKTTVEALKATHERELAALMGPEATAEWRLRTGDLADWASHLRGLEVSPEEMRLIAEWKSEHANNLNDGKANDPDARFAERYGFDLTSGSGGADDREKALNERIRNLLGDERFKVMQHANQQHGGAYVALFDISERFELPAGVIQQGMDMQQAAHTAAEQIRANTGLEPAQRRDALRAIQQETRQAVEELLGVEAFYTYQKHGGEWINGLSALNAGR